MLYSMLQFAGVRSAIRFLNWIATYWIKRLENSGIWLNTLETGLSHMKRDTLLATSRLQCVLT